MSYESKRIIGTVLISELLHAIQRRPVNNRRHFSIFVDEFQTFAAYADFSTLITQAPKFGVATTIAHHERYGQLADQPEMLGATDAIANKVLFQITAKDAADLSTDFAEEPPLEIRREQQLVISQDPVADLLASSHRNPEIRAFVAKYLRHIRERREDTKAQMEGERLKRMEYLDDAGIYALDERFESLVLHDVDSRLRILDKRGYALAGARAQTRVLQNLFDLSEGLRLTERGLNTFLSAVMEGRIASGQEQFSDFPCAGIRRS